jgi:hypothetical protein
VDVATGGGPYYTISGTLKYNNLAKTPMNNVTLTINPGGASSITDAGGNYSFGGLDPGTYTIWVTNINKAIGGINSSDAAQLNYWSVNGPTIEHVKFLAGEVNLDGGVTVTSLDALAIQNYFVFGTPFQRATVSGSSWVFWRAGEDMITNNSDPDRSLSEFSIVCSDNMTVNLYGQAIGEFSCNFTPNGGKNASSAIDLTYEEIKLAGANAEVNLPVRLKNSSSIGAISLILKFPPDLVEITGVAMKENDGQLAWSVNGNELRIGWNSLQPITFGANDELLIIHLRTTKEFNQGDAIRIELASDPLNELADGSFNAIPNVLLGTDVIENSAFGIDDPGQANSLTIKCIPNPFHDFTTISYNLPADGHVVLQINDLTGRQVVSLVNEFQGKGLHSMAFDTKNLLPGVYTSSIRLKSSTDEWIRIIKMVRNR